MLCLCEINRNLLLVITFLFIHGKMSNFENNYLRLVSKTASFQNFEFWLFVGVMVIFSNMTSYQTSSSGLFPVEIHSNCVFAKRLYSKNNIVKGKLINVCKLDVFLIWTVQRVLVKF